MFTFLLVVHAIIAASLVGVILVQRSEGGGMGMGGSPTGLMSARGAADFLTRATTVLATIFIILSIGLAALATIQRAPRTIDTSLARQTGALGTDPAAPAPADPLAAAAAAGTAGALPTGKGVTTVPATVPSAASEATPAPVAAREKAAPTPKATPKPEAKPAAPRPATVEPRTSSGTTSVPAPAAAPPATGNSQ